MHFLYHRSMRAIKDCLSSRRGRRMGAAASARFVMRQFALSRPTADIAGKYMVQRRMIAATSGVDAGALAASAKGSGQLNVEIASRLWQIWPRGWLACHSCVW